MKKNRNIIIIIITLLAVGFATVATTLYINGVVFISGDQEAFEGDVIFTDANVDDGDAVIGNNGKTITFETADLKSLNQISTLEYTVTNNSTQYDAEVSVTCNYDESVNDDDKKYIEWKNSLNNLVTARSSEDGTVDVKLISVAETEKSIKITCTLNANAVERDTEGIGDIVTGSSYLLSGIAKINDNGTINSLSSGNLIFFSNNQKETVISSDGSFQVSGLETGSHEVYYMGTQDISNLTKEEIQNNAIGYAEFSTDSIDSIVVLECINNKCPNNTSFILDDVEIEKEVNIKEVQKSPGIYDKEGNLLSELTPEMVEQDYDYSTNQTALMKIFGLEEYEMYNDDYTVKDNTIIHDIYEIVIPDGTTYIPESGFADAINLKKISVPESVIALGPFALSGLTSLESITIPGDLEYMDGFVFAFDYNLKNINIPNSKYTSDGLRVYEGSELISYPSATGEITLAADITSIGDGAFYGSHLNSIIISENIEYIGEDIFNYCDNLTTFIIENDEVEISPLMFMSDYNLVNIQADGRYTANGPILYEGSKLIMYPSASGSVTLSNGITEIGEFTFFYNEKITSIALPEGVTKIGKQAFYGNDALTSITLPNSLRIISDWAFAQNINIPFIVVPDSVEEIGVGAFDEIPHIYYNGSAVYNNWGEILMN